MHAQSAPTALGQNLEIAPRLRRLDDAKAVFLPGHREIGRVLASDLQKHPAIGSALVGLPGRMQKAWAEPDTGRRLGAVADHAAQVLHRFDMGGVALDIGKQSSIVAGAEAREM